MECICFEMAFRKRAVDQEVQQSPKRIRLPFVMPVIRRPFDLPLPRFPFQSRFDELLRGLLVFIEPFRGHEDLMELWMHPQYQRFVTAFYNTGFVLTVFHHAEVINVSLTYVGGEWMVAEGDVGFVSDEDDMTVE